MALPASQLPRDFDIRDPEFRHNLLLWSLATRCEIHELVLGTRKTIAASRLAMADADRVLAWRL